VLLQLLGDSGKPEAVRALAVALESTDEHTQHIAANALGRLGLSTGCAPLVDVLPSASPRLQAIVAESLGHLRCSAAVEVLAGQLMTSGDALVRSASARALGLIGAPHASQTLIAALGDGDRVVRLAAAQALGRMQVAAAEEGLQKLYDRERFHPLSRRTVRFALSRVSTAD